MRRLFDEFYAVKTCLKEHNVSISSMNLNIVAHTLSDVNASILCNTL